MGIGRLSLRRMFERILHALGFFLEFEAEQPSKGMIMSRRSLFKIQKKNFDSFTISNKKGSS